MSGRMVKEFFPGRLESGRSRKLDVEVSDLPPGAYIVVVDGDTFRTGRVLVVLR